MSTRQFKNYNYTEKEITAILTDDSGSKYLWIAFAKNTEGNCTLYKVSAHNPYQRFYEFEHTINEIVGMEILGSYLFLAFNDNTNIGYRYLKSSPLTSSQAITIPAGINEIPVDLAVDSVNDKLYFLMPGNASGEIAKITKHTSAGVYEETIELQESGTVVNNARSLTVDANGDLWVVTYTAPAQIVRVYQGSGGLWYFDVTEII